MKLPDVLHALVNLLPKDWDLSEHHEAIDDHFGSDAPAQETATKPPAKGG